MTGTATSAICTSISKRATSPAGPCTSVIMPEEDAEKLPYHPFDLTKVWYHKDYPLMEVGVLELNRNPENYFAEVEQAAFNPANLVPGIGVSPDKMLQGRLFSYGDAQRYRLGVNHTMIPVNRPRCPYHSFHRDGAMRVDGNYGGHTSYEPNSTGAWQEQPDFSEPPLKISGDAARWDYPCDDADYFEQPGKLFRVMTPEQQEELFGNTARALGDAPREIKLRHIRHCAKADPAYGAGVARPAASRKARSEKDCGTGGVAPLPVPGSPVQRRPLLFVVTGAA